MDYKFAELELKREPDDHGVVEGYASVFNVVDAGRDRVSPGAFRDSLSNRMPKMLWQHNPEEPIGVWDEVREDEKGLLVRGRLSKDVTKGREAMALLRMGAIDGLSIGYKTIEADGEGAGVRNLTKVALYEVSFVTIPMLPDAIVTGIKGVTTERDFEKFLRDAGYSKREAKAITSRGFQAKDARLDAVAIAAEREGWEALRTQIRQLQEAHNV